MSEESQEHDKEVRDYINSKKELRDSETEREFNLSKLRIEGQGFEGETVYYEEDVKKFIRKVLEELKSTGNYRLANKVMNLAGSELI